MKRIKTVWNEELKIGKLENVYPRCIAHIFFLTRGSQITPRTDGLAALKDEKNAPA